MSKTLDRINKVALTDTSGWLENAQWQIENEDWLQKSAMIAIRILREIRRQKPINGMTQKMLAERMGVSPQYINKVVKGQENLTLETIASIERVLGISLIEIPRFTSIQSIDRPVSSDSAVSKKHAEIIGMYQYPCAQEVQYFAELESDYIPSGTHG